MTCPTQVLQGFYPQTKGVAYKKVNVRMESCVIGHRDSYLNQRHETVVSEKFSPIPDEDQERG